MLPLVLVLSLGVSCVVAVVVVVVAERLSEELNRGGGVCFHICVEELGDESTSAATPASPTFCVFGV